MDSNMANPNPGYLAHCFSDKEKKTKHAQPVKPESSPENSCIVQDSSSPAYCLENKLVT